MNSMYCRCFVSAQLLHSTLGGAVTLLHTSHIWKTAESFRAAFGIQPPELIWIQTQFLAAEWFLHQGRMHFFSCTGSLFCCNLSLRLYHFLKKLCVAHLVLHCRRACISGFAFLVHFGVQIWWHGYAYIGVCKRFCLETLTLTLFWHIIEGIKY